MTSRLHREADRIARRARDGDPSWPAQLAVAVAICLNIALAEPVSAGPRWLVAAVEFLLLVGLVVATPRQTANHSPLTRRLSLTVVGVVSLANAGSLGILVHLLINGGTVGGHALIVSGAVLWATTVLIFAVWFWELDRGGAAARWSSPGAMPDFQFPQMENPQFAHPNWRPGFEDYLYLSLTNAMAFSPTDTMPLTRAAKLLMALQSVTAFLTIGLVLARAVNILG